MKVRKAHTSPLPVGNSGRQPLPTSLRVANCRATREMTMVTLFAARVVSRGIVRLIRHESVRAGGSSILAYGM